MSNFTQYIIYINKNKKMTIITKTQKLTHQFPNIQFNRTMFALDFSEFDKNILEYGRFITNYFNSSKAYFVHIERSFSDSPQYLMSHYKTLLQDITPPDEVLKHQLTENVQKSFTNMLSMDLAIEVLEGKPLDKLLHWIDIKYIDLLIVGNKKIEGGSGITALKVASMAKSSVCFVSENPSTDIRNILVPIDFSEYSVTALQTAFALANQLEEEVSITAIHVYNIPSMSYPMGRNHLNYANIVKENVIDTYKSFLKKQKFVDNRLKVAFIENVYTSVGKHLHHYAQKNKSDIIIIGANGHNRIDKFIFGSVVESLITYSKDIPVLVVR